MRNTRRASGGWIDAVKRHDRACLIHFYHVLFSHNHSGGGQGLLEDDDGFDRVLAGRSPGGRFGAGAAGRGEGGGRHDNSRRLSKDKKYGFGGPKRKLKQADTKSLNDFSTFNPKKGKTFGSKGGRGGKKGGGGAKKGGNRPGKTTRQKMRSKR